MKLDMRRLRVDAERGDEAAKMVFRRELKRRGECAADYLMTMLSRLELRYLDVLKNNDVTVQFLADEEVGLSFNDTGYHRLWPFFRSDEVTEAIKRVRVVRLQEVLFWPINSSEGMWHTYPGVFEQFPSETILDFESCGIHHVSSSISVSSGLESVGWFGRVVKFSEDCEVLDECINAGEFVEREKARSTSQYQWPIF